jgi:NADPH-dependent 2,4-dienoyl-CoA reductase/sulfur reductase-like enzyme
MPSDAAAPESAAFVRFRWNGRLLRARAGDTIAAALWRNGIFQMGVSRKLHRPLGLSGAYLQGVLVQVNGVPHVRADERLVTDGMDVVRQNAWPNARFDLLNVLRLLPASWVRGGFEHTMWFPSGTRRFAVWERLLSFLAGEVNIQPASQLETTRVGGERLDCDVVVVGGGPAGVNAANEARRAGSTVVLVTRGHELGETASALGVMSSLLDPGVTLLAGHVATGIYRAGRVVLAVPLDPSQSATVLVCRRLVLAHGKRSCPPLVPGHDLPGVLDAHSAISLARTLGPAFGATVIVGTGKRENLANALRRLGVNIVACRAVSELVRVEGRNRVTAVLLNGQRVACRTLVHAGPWRTDPALRFQACATGTLRLTENVPTSEHVEVIGAAAAPDETYTLGSLQPLFRVAICPCMDVTVGEVLAAADTAQSHPEELKRQTSCGMGPCQGFPCWEAMEAVLQKAQRGAGLSGRPAHRPPRRGITVDQAAGLEGLLELEP